MDNKYLTLKGRNKDTWYIQMRVPKDLQNIVKKDFIKQSTGTSDLIIARKERDELLNQFRDLQERAEQGEFKLFVDGYLGIPKDKLLDIQEEVTDKLREEYPWVGHKEQGELPEPTDTELAEVDALSYLITGERPDNIRYLFHKP